MFTGLFVLAVVIFGLFLLNKSAMKKFKIAFSALLGKGADNALKIDPVAVYRERLGKAAEDLKAAVTLLETHAALDKQLKRKLEIQQNNHKIIENNIKKHISEPDVAEKYALNLAKLEEDMAHTKTKLASSEKTYAQQVSRIKDLKELIHSYKDKANQLQADLQTSKAEAEISALTQKFNSDSMGLDDLKEVENIIQDQIDQNESKSAVAQDLHIPDVKEEILNDERKEKAKEIMERFKTKAK